MPHSGCRPRRVGRVGPLGAVVAAALLAATALVPARADEGMWLLNRPPAGVLKERHGFAPTAQWLEHLQKSAVRFSTGGSGSLISADGLVMTNHHVGADVIQKLSTPERDLMKEGFYAPAREDELPCPDLELNILWSIEDITDRVNAAVAPGMSPADANTARRKAQTTIESEAGERTGLLCQSVTLYQGARYHLYCYKRYTDVRLVFAPHQGIAFFGGDTDNFEYPRFDLDCCFFRVYEGGKPLEPEHFLDWSKSGTKEGDLVFVVGHPGRTRRLYTSDHLAFLRDVQLPTILRDLWRSEVKLQTFAGRGKENARIAGDDLFGVQNSRKLITGQLAGLTDPELMGRKAAYDAKLRSTVEADPENAKAWRDAWTNIDAAQDTYRGFYHRYRAAGINTRLASIGLTLVRLADELAKPNAERLREFRESELESVYLDLYSPAPIYPGYETVRLANELTRLVEQLGGDDPFVKTLLAGKAPRTRAEEIVRGTSLLETDARKALAGGGKAAIDASRDPIILLAKAIDPEDRALRKRYEDEVQAVERENYAKIAAAKFAAEGENTYPDATFTLRLAFGTVAGYEENGVEIPPFTTFAGLYERFQEHRGEPGFDLPPVWLDRKDDLDPSTPFNFVCTADIIGGNSGSPVVDRRGEVVGLIFDGNIHSLAADFAYDDRQGRAVAVDSRGMIEALRTVYGAVPLVNEITARKTTHAGAHGR